MASKTLYDPRHYRAIAIITGLLDCSVRQDIDWGEIDGAGGHPIYALGNAADPDNGIAAHVASRGLAAWMTSTPFAPTMTMNTPASQNG